MSRTEDRADLEGLAAFALNALGVSYSKERPATAQQVLEHGLFEELAQLRMHLTEWERFDTKFQLDEACCVLRRVESRLAMLAECGSLLARVEREKIEREAKIEKQFQQERGRLRLVPSEVVLEGARG